MENRKFKCARCGNCCRWRGYVRLKEDEIEKIAVFLNMSELDFTDRYTELTADRRNLTLIENEVGHCIFFEDNPPACRIEPVKPQQCRDFPLKWNFPGWEKECAGEIIQK